MKNKRDNLHIPELNDADVERLAKDVPALDKGAVKRITESCIDKMGTASAVDKEFSNGMQASGTDVYSRPKYRRIIAALAACAAVLVGAFGIVHIGRTLRNSPNDYNMSEEILTNIKTPADSGSQGSSADNVENTSAAIEIETETVIDCEPTAETMPAHPPTEDSTEATEPADPDVTEVCSHPLLTTTAVTSTAKTTVTVPTTTEHQEEPTVVEPTVDVQEKFRKLCSDTRGLWASVNSNDELEYISLDGSGNYVLYDFERIKLAEGKLEFVTCDCVNADHISLFLKLYDGGYYLEYDGTNLVSDDEKLIFSRKSFNPYSALPYPQNRMKGLWQKVSGNGPALIACGIAEGYIAYDRDMNIVNKGWMCWTELAMEDPFAVDTANIYSLDGADLSFKFTERNVVRSLDGAVYRRMGYDPANLDILLNG